MAKPFLLDTNILVHLVRDKELGRRINTAYDLTRTLGTALISVVTVGELQSFAQQCGWGEEKRKKVADIVGEVVIIDINHQEILDRYGEIDTFLVKAGRTVGDNDVWIAATASVADATLLTTDKDFDPLDGKFIQRFWIDPGRFKDGD